MSVEGMAPRRRHRSKTPPPSERPEICAAIRRARLRLRDEYAAKHPHATKNPFTQESVARKIGTTLKTYTTWEKTVEPTFARLRQIARGLGLAEDYFTSTLGMEPSESTERASNYRKLELAIGELERRQTEIERLVKLIASAVDITHGVD